MIPGTKVDLPEKDTTATYAAITLPERMSEIDLLLPDADLGAYALQRMDESGQFVLPDVHISRYEAITRDDFDMWRPAEETPTMGSATQSQQPPSSTQVARRASATMYDTVDVPILDFAIPGDKQHDEDYGAQIPMREPSPDAVPFMGGGDDDYVLQPVTHSPTEEQKQALAATATTPAQQVPQTPGQASVAEEKKKKRAVKRGRAIFDNDIEIDEPVLKKQARDRTALLRERAMAPRSREDAEKASMQAKSMESLIATPSLPVNLAPELARMFEKLAGREEFAKPTTVAPALPRPADEQMHDEDMGAAIIPGGFEDYDAEVANFTPNVGKMAGLPESAVPGTTSSRKGRQSMATYMPDADMSNFIDPAGFLAPETPQARVSEEFRMESARKRQEMQELRTKLSNKGITERTLNVYSLFNESFKTKDTLSFDDLLQGRKKGTAAKCFYELLMLKSKDLIDVKQEEPFGDITITKTELSV